jgi:hypothetical protein
LDLLRGTNYRVVKSRLASFRDDWKEALMSFARWTRFSWLQQKIGSRILILAQKVEEPHPYYPSSLYSSWDPQALARSGVPHMPVADPGARRA